MWSHGRSGYASRVQSDSPLVVEDVTFGYPRGEAVVRGVTGEPGVGRVTALIGPNAAGKSTLLKLMLGLLRPGSGRVMLGGREAWSLPPRVRARLAAYVPQRGAVSFAFTVRQVVEMSRFAHGGMAGGPAGAGGIAVARAMRTLELASLAERPFGELSGGQQARVLLARAMAQATGSTGGHGRVVLLDEPTASLDLEHVQRSMRLIRSLATGEGEGGDGRPRAGVVVLHDLNLASRWADDVWLMERGRLVKRGAWEQVLQTQVLEPVYRVGLRVVGEVEGGRPVWAVSSA